MLDVANIVRRSYGVSVTLTQIRAALTITPYDMCIADTYSQARSAICVNSTLPLECGEDQ